MLFLVRTLAIKASPFVPHIPLKAPKKISIPFSSREIDSVLSQPMLKILIPKCVIRRL